CFSSSSSRGLCLVLRADVPAKVSSVSLTCAPSSRPRCGPDRSVLVEGAGLVHGRPATLVALHLVLGLLAARADLPPGGLGVGGDLLLHGALGRSAVA